MEKIIRDEFIEVFKIDIKKYISDRLMKRFEDYRK